jgi:hypothetical protein
MTITDSARYQRQRRARRRSARRQLCAACSDVFVPSRSDQVFCGPVCKARDARRRKASGEPAGQRPPKPPFIEPALEPEPDERARRADLLASLIG